MLPTWLFMVHLASKFLLYTQNFCFNHFWHSNSGHFEFYYCTRIKIFLFVKYRYLERTQFLHYFLSISVSISVQCFVFIITVICVRIEFMSYFLSSCRVLSPSSYFCYSQFQWSLFAINIKFTQILDHYVQIIFSSGLLSYLFPQKQTEKYIYSTIW